MTGVKFHSTVICLFFFIAGCRPGVDPGFDCNDPGSATTAFETMMSEIADVLDEATDTSAGLANVEHYVTTHKRTIEACSERMNRSIQSMEPDNVMAYHEAFVESAAAKKFLDAQDRFQERATQDQNEALDELVSFLNLLSE